MRVHALDARLGLDRSLVARYLSWLGGLFHASFGNSAVALAESRPNPEIFQQKVLARYHSRLNDVFKRLDPHFISS